MQCTRDHVMRRNLMLPATTESPDLLKKVFIMTHFFRLGSFSSTRPHNLSFCKRMSISFAEASALRKAVQQGARSRNVQHLRSTTSDLSQSNGPHIKSMPEPTTYERVARPGAYYERPRLKRDLPAASVSALLR